MQNKLLFIWSETKKPVGARIWKRGRFTKSGDGVSFHDGHAGGDGHGRDGCFPHPSLRSYAHSSSFPSVHERHSLLIQELQHPPPPLQSCACVHGPDPPWLHALHTRQKHRPLQHPLRPSARFCYDDAARPWRDGAAPDWEGIQGHKEPGKQARKELDKQGHKEAAGTDNHKGQQRQGKAWEEGKLREHTPGDYGGCGDHGGRGDGGDGGDP